MRGTRTRAAAGLAPDRLIPAHAGNTPGDASSAIRAAAHPRACGEHLDTSRPIKPFVGSSPRMRGTPRRRRAGDRRRRLIPAHAGNTDADSCRSSPAAAHPRACGEHRLRRHLQRRAVGSSPRMRGTPGREPASSDRPRLIPAHAGNTTACSAGGSRSPAHPRACGEHEGKARIPAAWFGSSPRMRGTHSSRDRSRSGQRLIPAHAGNTA